ncbi:hypothetical protein BC941DRAFT_498969 [Chlamydoabsidia padenii]|nr:hypothetical protein BC941DRAFT_498969 [Chlamydoabsidia padenii]
MPQTSQNSTPIISAPQHPPTPDYVSPDSWQPTSSSPRSLEHSMEPELLITDSTGQQSTPEVRTTVPLTPEQSTTEQSTIKSPTVTTQQSTTAQIDSTSLQSSSSSLSAAAPVQNQKKCSRCRHYKSLDMFMGRTRSYRTCSDCRFGQTIPKMPPPTQDMVQQLSDLHIPTPALIKSDDNTDTSIDTQTELPSSTMTFNITMNDELMQKTDKQVVETILEVVKQRSGYRYSVQNLAKPLLSATVNFYGKCVQRSDLRRPLLPDQRKRQTKVLPTYDCKGKIAGSINRELRWIRLVLTHLTHHPPTRGTRKLMPEGAKLYIKDNAHSDKTNAELYRDVQKNFGNDISRAQVYFWRREARNKA